jgi:hypothetical protein
MFLETLISIKINKMETMARFFPFNLVTKSENMPKQKTKHINPFSRKDLAYWAQRWNLRVSQMKDLLGVTGSARIDVLENHLRKTGLL